MAAGGLWLAHLRETRFGKVSLEGCWLEALQCYTHPCTHGHSGAQMHAQHDFWKTLNHLPQLKTKLPRVEGSPRLRSRHPLFNYIWPWMKSEWITTRMWKLFKGLDVQAAVDACETTDLNRSCCSIQSYCSGLPQFQNHLVRGNICMWRQQSWEQLKR